MPPNEAFEQHALLDPNPILTLAVRSLDEFGTNPG